MDIDKILSYYQYSRCRLLIQDLALLNKEFMVYFKKNIVPGDNDMNYFKLQTGCMVIVVYVILIYAYETAKKDVGCNKIYDALITVAPWAIFFDGLTAWTVNNMDKVSKTFNLIAHGLFFELMVLSFSLVYLYMIYASVGIPQKTWLRTVIVSPAVISMIGVLVFLDKTYYIHGTITDYSMGPSVIICYVSLIIHFSVIMIIVSKHHNTIEKKKKVSIITSVVIGYLMLIVQVIYPEALISALLLTFMIVSFYINFEDPSIKRLQKYNDDMIVNFATLVENRDDSTGGHVKRTKEYVKIIIDEMKKDPKYRMLLSKDYVNDILNAAPMHDIGKISTPDVILKKPGKLTDEEFAIMKQHALKGAEIIESTLFEQDSPEMKKVVYEVARYHHEKWNGKGYPDGLSGNDIPLHARIMAIADVFDAVSAKRCYRDAMPINKCFEIIEEGSGRDFDPDLAEKFINAREKVEEIYNTSKI